MKKNFFYKFLITFLTLICLLFILPLDILAQTNQSATVGLQSTTIISLFPGYFTETNSSYDKIVVCSMFGKISHFHVTTFRFIF